MEHHCEIKNQDPSQNEYKMYCLNGVESYHQVKKILWAVFAYRFLEENDIKGGCGATKLEFKNRKDEKFLIRNLTRRKVFNAKSDAL